MPKVPFKCNKCGAPIELDPYKDFVKCSYCGSTNIFENGRLISKSDRYLNKVGEFLSRLKQKKVLEQQQMLVHYYSGYQEWLQHK